VEKKERKGEKKRGKEQTRISLPLDLIDKFLFDAQLRDSKYNTILRLPFFELLNVRILRQDVDIDNPRMTWTSNAMPLDRSFIFHSENTEIVLSMIGTHPVVISFIATRLLIRSYRQGWIDAVHMPAASTVVALNNRADCIGSPATGHANNEFAFSVEKSQVMLFISAQRTGPFTAAIVNRIDGDFFVFTVQASTNAFKVVSCFRRQLESALGGTFKAVKEHFQRSGRATCRAKPLAFRSMCRIQGRAEAREMIRVYTAITTQQLSGAIALPAEIGVLLIPIPASMMNSSASVD
jgi:hypothetical protein